MFRYIFALLALVLTRASMMQGVTVNSEANYVQEIHTWREAQDANLRSTTGWLTLVGLEWLRDGASRIGSASDNQIKLPASTPAQLGTLNLTQGQTKIKFAAVDGVLLDGKAVQIGQDYPLVTDAQMKPTEISVGSVTFFLIERANGIGVRIKDSASSTRKDFAGRQWFDVDPKFRVQAIWREHKNVQKIIVPDIIGNQKVQESTGYAEFNLEGKTYHLYPLHEKDHFFFIFRDATSGKESYGAARFLTADLPKDGKLILDFNKAVNPPCAFTSFATCPLAPKENVLKVGIFAGERKPKGH